MTNSKPMIARMGRALPARPLHAAIAATVLAFAGAPTAPPASADDAAFSGPGDGGLSTLPGDGFMPHDGGSNRHDYLGSRITVSGANEVKFSFLEFEAGLDDRVLLDAAVGWVAVVGPFARDFAAHDPMDVSISAAAPLRYLGRFATSFAPPQGDAPLAPFNLGAPFAQGGGSLTAGGTRPTSESLAVMDAASGTDGPSQSDPVSDNERDITPSSDDPVTPVDTVETPLPAAAPLLATGVAALLAAGWSRRRASMAKPVGTDGMTG